MPIILFQMDPLEQVNKETDSTYLLALESLKRGYRSMYCNPTEVSINQNELIVEVSDLELKNNKIQIKYNSKRIMSVSNFDVVLIRQDPPFNMEYIIATHILDAIKTKVKIINDPTSIRNVSEKLYSVKYQKFMPSTIFSQNISEIKKFFRKHKKVILKPINSFSGNNIYLLSKFNLKLVKKIIKKHDHIMCQKFLPNISKGDKRVFIINGSVCGAISRVPIPGSFLSNMSKGAKPINIKLTKTEKKISKLIANDLKKEKIFFAGIDFIDQKLNGDINVTSPTGLKTLFDLSGENLAKIFWEKLKA